jgi:hypothetical protein
LTISSTLRPDDRVVLRHVQRDGRLDLPAGGCRWPVMGRIRPILIGSAASLRADEAQAQGQSGGGQAVQGGALVHVRSPGRGPILAPARQRLIVGFTHCG